MHSFLKILIPVLSFVLFQTLALGQEIKQIDFQTQRTTTAAIQELGELQIKAIEYTLFEMDIETLRDELLGVAKTTDPTSGFTGQIEIPHPDGETYLYNVKLNTTMSEGLQETFPQIRSYDAYGVDLPAKAKIDITPKGFHAMIMQAGESTIFIDPAINGNTSHYIVYHLKDFQTDKKLECLVTSEQRNDTLKSDFFIEKNFLSCELRTYRLAVSATVEYTNYHGGNITSAAAAQVTSINRVNGIYERDLAVTFSIIPNNNLIIYEGDPNTDPFSNGNSFAMLGENQTNTDAVIGSANYDIGHVFGTNSGGVAGLGVICLNGQKARGVTGSNAPVNDPFDVDYVAHEMGHQFGGNHTQNNNCNRNNATAMEPGSASTILGYAGICQPNIQNNSDDHFHGISLQEIGSRVEMTSCEARTPLTNNPPIINGTNANVYVPASTPFALTAFAFDPDGDVLSYCWEQMNNQVSTQPPVSTSFGGPNFRSFSPVNSPTRYFPSFANQISNSPFALRWEVVPTVSRTMNFRITVRDQPLNVAGCADYTDVTVTTVADAGPFVVLYPSDEDIIWNAFDNETVTWDVANTNEAPINCDTVDIFLSIDGGLSYPITLATNVPNNGSAVITVPNLSTKKARVMVMCSSGTFFDISDNNFEIVRLKNDFVVSVNPPLAHVCTPENATFIVHVDSLDNFNDPVELSISGLPNGAIATLADQTLIPEDSTTLTISNTLAIDPGVYSLTLEATSTTGTKTNEIELIIRSGTPATVVQLSPAEGSGDAPIVWEASPEIGVTYDIQIASDDQFTALIDEATGLTSTSYISDELTPSSNYFWRIRAVTDCGKSAWTAPYFDAEKVTLFPNPTTDNLTISWIGEVTRIEISDATGKIVERRQFNKGTSTVFDLSRHRAGVYHISISSNTGRFVYDVVKL